MGIGDEDLTGGAATRAGASRRDVLLGATGLAVAAAGTVFGSGVASAAPAAGPMSMEIAGLGTFEVLAFQWGASNSGTLLSGGGGAGKANIQDLSVTKYTDTFSPALMEAITSGQHFQRATLTFAPQSGKSSLVLEVSPVLVTSLAMGGQSADTRLTENLSLGFARFRYSYGQASTESDITKG